MTDNVYIEFARRWFWLIGIGVVIAMIATSLALDRRTPLYQSTATIQVGRTIDDTRVDVTSLAVSEQLVPIYAELAKRDPVLEAAADELGVPLSANQIRSRLLVSPVSRTQLIDIRVVDANPEIAAALANEIARQMVLQSPDTTPEDGSQQFIVEQLTDLQAKITDGQEEIAVLTEEITESTSAAEVNDAQTRLDALQAQVDIWQQSYTTLLTVAEPGRANIVRVINQALPAVTPLPAPVRMYYGFAIVIGAGTAAALALGLTTLFSAIRRSEEIRRIVSSVPVITIPFDRDIRQRPLMSSARPASSIAAAYRVLRNVMQTEQSDAKPVAIAVMSSRPGEGKTTTIANLAVALASTDRKIILVDANVRNPSIDQIFGTDTRRGLSDVVLGQCLLDDALMQTAHPNLSVLGAGSITGNYTDFLSPGRVRMVVQSVTRLAEITLIDTPGIQEDQEALLLAKEVDAVIVVVEAGRIRPKELERTLETLQRSHVAVVTIALNKARSPFFSLDRLPFSREARLKKVSASRRAARGVVETIPIGAEPHLTEVGTPLKGSAASAYRAIHTSRTKSA